MLVFFLGNNQPRASHIVQVSKFQVATAHRLTKNSQRHLPLERWPRCYRGILEAGVGAGHPPFPPWEITTLLFPKGVSSPAMRGITTTKYLQTATTHSTRERAWCASVYLQAQYETQTKENCLSNIRISAYHMSYVMSIVICCFVDMFSFVRYHEPAIHAAQIKS